MGNDVKSTAPAFPGRETILYEIRQALGRAASGGGGCLVVEGAAGTGKSELLRLAGMHGEASGFGLVAGTAVPLDTGAPFSTLRRVLRENLSARDYVLLTDRRTFDPLAPVDRIVEFLRRSTRDRPLLVALDDAHLVDDLTADALRNLIDASVTLPVLWILARGASRTPGHAQETIDWLIREGAARHRLESLSPEAVAEISAELLGACPDDDVLALVARVNGNPFLLNELLVTSLSDGRICVQDGVAVLLDAEPAPAFRQAVVHHLRGLSHECLRILDAVAVLGQRFSIHEAAGLLGRNPVELLPLIGELIAASVLEDEGPTLAFRHPLVRETLYDRLSEPTRTALHREAAATLWREGRSAPTFLEHLMLGRRGEGDGLVPAAAHPEARFAPETEQFAPEAGQLALTGTGRGPAAPPAPPPAPYAELMYRTTLRYSAAQVQGLHAQMVAHARAALRIARDHGDRTSRAHHQLWLAVALTASDEFDQAGEILAERCDPSDHVALPWVRPMWHYHRAQLKLAAGQLEEADEDAVEAVRICERLAAPALAVGPLALRIRVAVHRHELTEANRHVVHASRLSAAASGAAREELSWVTALLHSAEENRESALDTLSPVYSGVPKRPLLLTREPHAGACLVRTAMSAGDSERATAVAEAARLVATRNPTVVSAVAAAAHAEGVLCNDVGRLRAAVSAYRSGPRPLSLAAATEDLALAENEAGGRSTAIGLLNEALARYQNHGARGDALRVRKTLRSLAVRRRTRGRDRDLDPVEGPRARWDQLTPSELRVVRLVAQGLTNREVAEKLFLSPHTVDSHLRHSFTKLGVTSRVELTRQVLTHEEVPPAGSA
ncbi:MULTISPECIES: LuxR family transcriptional regulator [Streptomyces]|uniref:helix-turn-helix transcriptional regulator n=1 Tax=Streptomyces TaxID=1883 RepID=UPI001C48CA79|nr:LuxR family transcriptional regulator [Streptomyces sp. MW-W600-10]MBV7248488.1 AAA family ATPase [Streptomyces sp. MW-W600-10]